MAVTLRRDADPAGRPLDDYLVEGERQPDGPSIGARFIYGLQVALIIVMAVLSLAVFWLLGLWLNLF
jgi:hypothetical protein